MGECCIRTLEAIGKLNLEHKLIPGTLDYMIEQQKVVDETGRKGFEYRVTYCVTADEPAFTEEEIEKEVKELAEKLKIETAEMFRKAEEKEKQEDAGADT